MDTTKLGQIAFDSYSQGRMGKAYDGTEIPTWESLKPDIAQAWISAATAVYKAMLRLDSASELIVTTGPSVVCLCGSTRFYNEFQQANYRETMLGRIVLSVGFYPHSQQQAHGEEIGCSPEVKMALDELHLRKIDLADEVLILNVGGYIGQSTERDLRYALANGKRVRFWEPEKAPDMNEFAATAKI